MRKEFAGDATFTAKLKDEARITASIKHPHVVEVFSVGEDHGQFYVVMELVDGGSLDDRMEDEKRISELPTLEVGLQVAKGLQAALQAERELLAAYQFENAVASLEKLTLTATTLQAERDAEMQRAGWLLDWKTKLIGDINGTGYGGVVIDIHGVHYDGPLRRATTEKLELKTSYGSVMTGWLNLSPEMLLKMSTAFIRPTGADIPKRQWRSAIFAAQTGQMETAKELARKAAEAKSDFRDLLTRFFPAAKK